MSPDNVRAAWRELTRTRQLVRVPGVYDGLSARIAQQVGFSAVAFSGNAVSASLLGMPDVGMLGMSENLEHVGRIARQLDIPVVCDADTGYGGVLNVVRTVQEFEAAGIAAIHQETVMFDELSVAENIFMAATNQSNKFLLDTASLKNKARSVLAQLADIDPAILVRDLSISNQQLVEIAKALTLDCRILILDEPTAALTEREAQLLFSIMRQLTQQGIAIIYISHRMVEIFENCDRVTVFRDGQCIRTDKVSETTPEEVVNAMVGRKIESLYPPKLRKPTGPPVLQVDGFSDSRFRDISFELRSGEILGVAGLIGAGRSEIMRGICRLEGKASGRVRLHGRDLDLKSYAEAINEGIVYLSEDRKGDGVFLDLSVAVNVSDEIEHPAVPELVTA